MIELRRPLPNMSSRAAETVRDLAMSGKAIERFLASARDDRRWTVRAVASYTLGGRSPSAPSYEED